ncbi:MAG: GTP-binding protein, partial [Candidatus Heimdallarchaeota archaeon]|nr:GTP-binding protein [Candidatus Heimdallarchaeota archaeon]
INYRIWDLSGKKKFEKIRKSYYKGARGSILFFDLTQKETLDNIPNWYNETIFEEPDQFTVLVGTKKDLSTRRQVTKEEAETLSKQLNCKFYTEVSALTGEGVNELFMKISKLLQAVFDDSK